MKVKFEELLGKTLSSIEILKSEGKVDDEIVFTTKDEEEFLMYHEQDCCEDVHVKDIAGDLADLLHDPILQAECVQSERKDTRGLDGETWTFYKLATIRGSVTISWVGTSDGYYSEEVNFAKIDTEIKSIKFKENPTVLFNRIYHNNKPYTVSSKFAKQIKAEFIK